MAAFNFPNSPSTNDTHTENGVTYKWNGTVWKRQNASYTDATNLNVTGIGTFAGDVIVNGDELFIADSIKHVGDTDTLISFPSNDTIRFNTAGNERLRIDSSGHMGLGTNNPTDTGGYGRALDITGGASGAAIYLRSANGDTGQISLGSGDLTIRTRQADPIIFNTNNGERLRITSTGNIGVGTITPQVQTHIFGADAELLIERGGYSEAELWLGFPSGQPFIASGPGKGLKLGGNGKWNEALRITSNGDVTIPVDSKKFLAGAGNDVRVYHDGSDSYFDSITGNLYVYNHASGNLDLGTAGNTRFRINASGSFGIGGGNYGSSGQVIKSAGSGAAPAWGPMAFSSFAVICDKKGSNDDGGTATAGNYTVYDVRNLNHELADPDSIVSISSNQFTLVAGTYWVQWEVPAYGVDMFTAELINVTDGTGNRGSAPGKCNTDSVTYCHGSSYFTISASKTFEIRQHNQTARSGNGLGVRAGYSNSSINETFYTFVYIYKK